MATCQTKRWVSTSPYVRLTVTEVTGHPDMATKARLSYKLEYISDSPANTIIAKAYIIDLGGTTVASGTYDINKKTGTNTITSGTIDVNRGTATLTFAFSVDFAFLMTWSGVRCERQTASTSISVSAKSYAITYNANGGTGAPSAQSKRHGETLTLSSTKPTRTGYKFIGWGKSSTTTTATYSPGYPYTANASIPLYAVWEIQKYSVSYNANGGTGAPSAQTKEYGKDLILASSPILSRTGYTFKGWATSPTGAVVYQPGGRYTANAVLELYAIWESTYERPKIYNVSTSWGDDVSNTDENGIEYRHISIGFHWETTYADPTISTFVYDANGTLLNSFETVGNGYSDDGLWEILKYEDCIYRTDKSYTIQVTIDDGGGSTTVTRTLTGEAYSIDFLAGGNGVAFGKPAETEGIADFAYKARFAGGIQNIVLLKTSDLNEVTTPNTYVSKNQGAASYANCPVTSGTFVLEVMSAGAENQAMQRLTTTFKDGAHETYIRHYFQNSWGNWVLVYGGDTGWIDLPLNTGFSHGSDMGYLRGRIKDGVLYIRGDVKGFAGNYKTFAYIPDSLLDERLPSITRFVGVYRAEDICSISLSKTNKWLTTTALHKASDKTWDYSYVLSINVAIAL